MNDQQIYELMAVSPSITALQISGALDESLSDVSTALRGLVECGDVMQSRGISSLGAPAMVYNLSVAFKESKEYRALLALMAISSDVKVATATMTPPIEPVEPQVSPPAETRIEMAVAYLEIHGAVTEDAMRIAIGLKPGAYPVAYLFRATKSGMLHKRIDGMWAIGPAPLVAVAKPKAKPAPKAFTATRPKVGPVAQFSATAQPDDVVAIDGPAPGPVEPPAALRCGLWSDGTVELQRNGCTVAAMAQCDAEFIAAFLARVRAPAAN